MTSNRLVLVAQMHTVQQRRASQQLSSYATDVGVNRLDREAREDHLSEEVDVCIGGEIVSGAVVANHFEVLVLEEMDW